MNLPLVRLAVSVVALALGVTLVARVLLDRSAPPLPVATPPAEVASLGKWVPAASPGEPVALAFTAGDGTTRELALLRGRVVLVNLWATWCAPCIKEMPALDRLQAKLGGPDFEVVAIALDRQGERVVRPFFENLALKRLALNLDPSNAASRVFKASGLPVSVVLDREGRELGRVLGAAEWDAPEFESVLRDAMRR
ncbi:MAG: TlpA family protein disulfide reductase [Alphaproteobacteria bacterium]|nr:TlpA family protein disulfide reductase [Alphaproteobacteria bacterium]